MLRENQTEMGKVATVILLKRFSLDCYLPGYICSRLADYMNSIG